MARTKPERRRAARPGTFSRHTFGWRRACGALVLVLTVLCAPQAPVAADEGARVLDILLTNDDGFEAQGIRALQAALLAAGHRVTLIAPRDNQSGASARISTGPVRYREEAPGVWAVDGSPADAVAVGLQVIIGDRLPDLVVSGANFGHNVGATANVSGTVGAGLIAEYLGVPAVAVSVGMEGRAADTLPEHGGRISGRGRIHRRTRRHAGRGGRRRPALAAGRGPQRQLPGAAGGRPQGRALRRKRAVQRVQLRL
jgi:hypothetical protein